MEIRIGEQHEDPSVVSGSASHVTDQLLGFTRLGFTAMNLALVGPDEREQLELLARDVIPAVHAAVSSGAAPQHRS
jgi:hypothetical protein